MVPVHPAMLEPAIPDLQSLQHKEREKRWMDSSNYDRRHRVRNLPDLSPGDQVWITDTRSTGTVMSKHETPRSYLVSGSQGTLRRNRRHLVPISADNSSEALGHAAEVDPQDTVTETAEESTSVLALDEPCGVYTLPCTQGLRCIPPHGEQSPLQALLQGRGLCKNIKSAVPDVPPPTEKGPLTAVNNEKGPCRKLLNAVLQSIELTVIYSIQDIYIPNCDRQGFFRRKQCRSSRGMQRGHCWCVDEKGEKITSRKKEDGTISCTSA
ncbi:insulin-like growth factor-binding protein 6a [Paramisgurnus dabryanus]|uniref:insulin-like growth factor-binding protein 6a n=1 Tax=Paramisgurnus dabryanus TaxID=90735 RepID=UPI0031F4716B